MLYIISVIKHNPEKKTVYKGFETCSESIMTMQEHILKEVILNNQIQVINATIQNDNIVIKDWGKGLDFETGTYEDVKFIIKHSGPVYVLLAREKDRYKLIDYEGRITKICSEKLEKIVKLQEVANCNFMRTTEGNRLKPIDIYEISRDIKFEKLIASKYETFIAKALLLGYGDCSFIYEIENYEVKLKNYTGSSKEIMLPSFITAIKKEAFYWKGIKSVNLNEGLKVIGTMAFAIDGDHEEGIAKVEIPSTVEIIGLGAFLENNKLFRGGYNLNKDRFKLLNDKTIVLEQNY